VYVGEEAWFSGNLSFDPDGYIVSWDWDFGDGTNGSGETITHVYTMLGNYTVTLTVTDNGGLTDSDWVHVIVVGNETNPVILQTDPADWEVEVPLNYSITVVFSKKMDPTTLNWTINPDPGGWTETWSMDTTVLKLIHSNPFTLSTVYEVEIAEVKDIDGYPLVSGPVPNPWRFVTMGENLPPVAIAIPEIQHVYVGEEAWFDGILSYDPDGYIVNYSWDFGDGTFGNGIWVTHNYTTVGTYNVTLTVTDNSGATDSDSVLVIVEDGGPPPGNIPPVAIAEPPFQMVNVEEEAWFSGNWSFDPDGYIVSYDWDFGDGTNGTGITTTHIYTSPGCYIVTLTVTDNNGATDTDTVMVMVQEPPIPNRSPVADAGKDRFASPLEELTFNGNGSFDLDGTIVSYLWDFGDGFTAGGMVVKHTYTDYKTYIVTLEVVDDEGATDTETCIVFVEIQNSSEEKMEPNIPNLGPTNPKTPMLILTAGLINMATFEDEIEKMIPVEVTAYYDTVHNVRIELIDDGGLDIEIIPIVQDVPEGGIVRFFLKIKGPELPDDIRSTGITIKLKAVGDGMESNIEHVDVIVREEKEESSSASDVTVISTMGTITIAAILAAIIGRRLL